MDNISNFKIDLSKQFDPSQIIQIQRSDEETLDVNAY